MVHLSRVFWSTIGLCGKREVFPHLTHKQCSLKTIDRLYYCKEIASESKGQHNPKFLHTPTTLLDPHYQNPPIYRYPTSFQNYMRDKDIFGLYISMNNRSLMQVIQCRSNFIKDFTDLVYLRYLSF